MDDETQEDNVVKIFPHNGRFFDPAKEENKARDLATDLVATLFRHHGQDPDLAGIVVQRFALDDCLDMESSVARIIGNATMRAEGSDQQVEIVPFENDAPRFLAWSLAATALDPRPTSDMVAQAIRNSHVDVVNSYIEQVKDLSRDLVNGDLDIFRRS